MRKLLLVITVILLPQFSFGQILNLDRTIEGDSVLFSKKIKMTAVLGASFYALQQSYAFINKAVNCDLSYYVPHNNVIVLSGKYNITTAQGINYQNLGYVHLRFRDNDTRKVSPEFFTQYQWNSTLGLDKRYLLGTNLRIRLLENKHADVYYGLGVMYESEQWNYSGVTDYNQVPLDRTIIKNDFFKTNQYIKASILINSHCDFATSIFLQNKIEDFTNVFRLSDYTSFNFIISRRFSFSIAGDIAFDNKPVVPIQDVQYTMSSTISLKL